MGSPVSLFHPQTNSDWRRAATTQSILGRVQRKPHPPGGAIEAATPNSSVRPLVRAKTPKKSDGNVPTPMTEAETTDYRKFIEIQTKYLGKTPGEAALAFLSQRSRAGKPTVASSPQASSSLGTPPDVARRETLVTPRAEGPEAPRRAHASAGHTSTPFPWPFPNREARPPHTGGSQTSGQGDPRPAQKPALEALVHAYTRKNFPERQSPVWDAWQTPPARLTPVSNSRRRHKGPPDR